MKLMPNWRQRWKVSMSAHEEPNFDDRSRAGAPEGSSGQDGEAPKHPAETLGSAQAGGDETRDVRKVERPQLDLIAYLSPAPATESVRPMGLWKWVSGLAAGLALIAAVTAVGLYDHARQSSLLAAKAEESRDLAQTVEALKNRIDAIEAARSRDESADLRKVAAEMKAENAATHDLSGAMAQLTARVDRVDHDQNARLDKLADRIDHDSTARIADLASRVDKLEKRPVATVAAVVPPPPPQTIPAAAKPPAAPAKPDVVVSNETTGSIDKPRPPLRGYWLVDVQGDFALIDGRDGPQQVAPGDFLPGAGRVLRIERHGRDWVVVTSAGIIASDQTRF
jgi:hypothetical protein